LLQAAAAIAAAITAAIAAAIASTDTPSQVGLAWLH
jgi:hypothetical protein